MREDTTHLMSGIIPCPACGSQVSSKAKKCPDCGAAMPSHRTRGEASAGNRPAWVWIVAVLAGALVTLAVVKILHG